jgi:hypothetical protein
MPSKVMFLKETKDFIADDDITIQISQVSAGGHHSLVMTTTG